MLDGDWSSDVCSSDLGEYLPETEAKISIFDRGFIFADGIYEVSAVLGGRLIDNGAHLDRLERSVREIALALPLSRAEIVAIEEKLIALNGLDEGLVYIQVTRGAADRDFAFPKGVPPTFIAFTQEKRLSEAPQAKTGIRVVTTPDLRWKRRDIKSVALLPQVLAKQFAAANGAQEVWMIEDGLVTEGGSSTAWILGADGRLVTRPLSHAVLPGITRQAVMKLMEDTGIGLDERPFTLAEALAAKEAFISSAGNLIMPVVEIDGKMIGDGRPGPVATRLREIYIDIARKGGRLG
jgi:D-alanine transaminase